MTFLSNFIGNTFSIVVRPVDGPRVPGIDYGFQRSTSRSSGNAAFFVQYDSLTPNGTGPAISPALIENGAENIRIVQIRAAGNGLTGDRFRIRYRISLSHNGRFTQQFLDHGEIRLEGTAPNRGVFAAIPSPNNEDDSVTLKDNTAPYVWEYKPIEGLRAFYRDLSSGLFIFDDNAAPNPFYVIEDNKRKSPKTVYVRDNNEWKKPKKIYVRDDNKWKLVDRDAIGVLPPPRDFRFARVPHRKTSRSRDEEIFFTDASYDETHWDAELGTDKTFATPVWTTEVTSTTQVFQGTEYKFDIPVNSLQGNTRYYARARSSDDTKSGIWTRAIDFTTLPHPVAATSADISEWTYTASLPVRCNRFLQFSALRNTWQNPARIPIGITNFTGGLYDFIDTPYNKPTVTHGTLTLVNNECGLYYWDLLRSTESYSATITFTVRFGGNADTTSGPIATATFSRTLQITAASE